GVERARLGEGHRRSRARARPGPRQGATAARLPRLRRSRRQAGRAEGRLDESDGRPSALRAGRVRHRSAPQHLAQATVTTTPTTVSLLRWLRRQMREPTPQRERLEAAIANDDPAEARRIVAVVPFSEAQRRHVELLLDEWQRRS